MTALHVQDRPFPGHVPVPGPDPAMLAGRAIAAARKELEPVEPCPAGECRACDAGWRYERKAIGRCCVCGQQCRSTDPDDRPRHPTCEVGA